MWPTLESARPGDLLLGPAGGGSPLGKLLGALDQHFDHLVMFVEDDGQTVRHCTADNGRMVAKEYRSGPFNVPLDGFRADVITYGWPSSITQTLGEVVSPGATDRTPNFRSILPTPR